VKNLNFINITTIVDGKDMKSGIKNQKYLSPFIPSRREALDIA